MLTEIRLETSGVAGRISFPAGMRPAPGQYLAASSPSADDLLAIPLFPSKIDSGEIWAAAPLPEHWNAGMKLNLRGPLGNGFHLPPTARRIALASLEGAPDRLLPLAHQALQQQAAVAIYSSTNPTDLPTEVEVLPLDLLPEAPGWADFLALEVALPQIAAIGARLKLRPHQRPDCQTQVLVRADMPCNGLAECGICSVITQEGWAYTCNDGPVFDYHRLEGA